MGNNKIAYAEVYEILELMEKKYIDKIPKKLVEMFREERNSKYRPIIDVKKPLYEQNLQRETLVILAVLNLNYWCESEEEKQNLLRDYAENEKKNEIEIRNKYNPDNIFKNEMKIQEKAENQLVVYNDGILKKLWNKIKTFFVGRNKK